MTNYNFQYCTELTHTRALRTVSFVRPPYRHRKQQHQTLSIVRDTVLTVYEPTRMSIGHAMRTPRRTHYGRIKRKGAPR
jgi:hypothetical protein